MSDARRWEVAIDIAARIERAADDGAPDELRSEIGEALGKLITRFDCSPPDDLPARAMVALAEAWLASLEADELDQFLDRASERDGVLS